MNKIMKYKVGDKVTLINRNIMTIDQIDDISKWYRMKEDPWNYYTDEMIEGLVEKDVNIDVAVKETIKDISDKVVDTIMGGPMVGKSFNLPQGYQFKDENGNVINAMKIVLEKKKKEYPKLFVDCCAILYPDDNFQIVSQRVKGHKGDLLFHFQKLLICRDAYWKIAGEEMGLGKPWEPDWTNYNDYKFVIGVFENEIIKCYNTLAQYVLAFPTEEMRDAFYENFKEEIEICKEFL